jgi:glycosyltransferase involved in cell wall biosynthesis
MRILLLTQVLPFPADSGPKVKTLNVLKYLARKGEVTLVSFVRGDQTRDIEALRRYCAEIHTIEMRRDKWRDGLALLRSLARAQPWMMLRDDRAEMRALVDRLSAARRFDIAHADQLNMAQFALRARGAKTVLDLHNALWLLYKRLAATTTSRAQKLLLNRDWPLLKRYEGAMCRAFDAVMAVSEEDRAALEDAMGQPRPDMLVVPITVDGDEIAAVVRAPGASRLLHIGTMYWPPNIEGVMWFLDHILPAIRAARPDAGFDCVGARPPQALLARNSADGGVNVTGYVEDVGPHLRNAALFVVPLLAGGGMRVKILNALAQGLPIVTTRLGCEGIALEHGVHALIADTPADFAEASLRLLNDRAYADALGRNARQLFESRYDYRAALRPMDRIYG